MEMLSTKRVCAKRIKCPECLNYMDMDEHPNGSAMGRCSNCHSLIIFKQHSENERRIRIVRR